jgi:hypothetical protein
MVCRRQLNSVFGPYTKITYRKKSDTVEYSLVELSSKLQDWKQTGEVWVSSRGYSRLARYPTGLLHVRAAR